MHRLPELTPQELTQVLPEKGELGQIQGVDPKVTKRGHGCPRLPAQPQCQASSEMSRGSVPRRLATQGEISEPGVSWGSRDRLHWSMGWGDSDLRK